MDQLGRAQALLRSGDIVGAEAACRAAEATPERRADALQMQALIARYRGDHGAALAHMKAAVKAEPRNGDRRLELALLAEDVGAYYDAVAHLEALIAGCGEVPEALHALGRSLLCLGQPLVAAQRLERAVEAQPDLADAWRELARAYFASGQAPMAVAALEEANRHSSDLDLRLELAEAYLRSGAPALSLRLLKQLTRSQPGNPDAWCSLGRALRALGSHERALRAHQKALSLAERDPLLRHELATSQVLCGELDALSRVGVNHSARAPQLGRAWCPSEPLEGPLWLLADAGPMATLVMLRAVEAVVAACAPGEVGIACDPGMLPLLAPWARRGGLGVCALSEVGPSWYTLRLSRVGEWLPDAYGSLESVPLVPQVAELGQRHRVGIFAADLERVAATLPSSWEVVHDSAGLTALPDAISGEVALLDAIGDGAALSQLAYEVAGLDLVITEHPLVAHVAGVMGTPGWLVVPAAPAPFFLYEACATYPSITLLRTASLGGVRSAAEVVTEAAMASQVQASQAVPPLRAAQG